MRRLLFPVLALITLHSADTPHEDQLARLHWNKVLLLGPWSGRERANWENLLADETLFSANVQILDSSRWSDKVMGDPDPKGFEIWVRDRFGLGSSRWVLLDIRNRLIASGVNVPSLEDLTGQLARSGFQSPLTQLKLFLGHNPDHLEARADLLREIRRRSLRLCAKYKDDPTPEHEITAWAPLAQAVDDLFKTDWRGLQVRFFNPASDQPEAQSPTMKAIFARHIGKVEAALRTNPTNEALWQLWAWMARTLGNRPWKPFLNSLDPFLYPDGPACPSAEVSIWLTKEAMAKQDWETVAEFGLHFKKGEQVPGESNVVWSPSRTLIYEQTETLPYDPLPRLEALIRLGRIQEANDAFDAAIRLKAASPPAMVRLATKAGNRELAKAWAQTKASSSEVRSVWAFAPGVISLGRWNENSSRRDSRVTILVPMHGIVQEEADALGWKGNEEHWALFDGTGRVAAEGAGNPTLEVLQPTLDRLGFRSKGDLAKAYLRDHPKDPIASRTYAMERGWLAYGEMTGPFMLDSKADEAIWSDVAQAWRNFFDEDPVWKTSQRPTLSEGGSFAGPEYSPLMRDLAGTILPKIEAALKQAPTSQHLWQCWQGWRETEGKKRPISTLAASLEASPMGSAQAIPPREYLSFLLEESRELGRWSEVIAILRIPWERELARFDALRESDPMAKIEPVVWESGRDLVKAMLEAGKPDEADEILNAWLSRGGSLSRGMIPLDVALKLGHQAFVSHWATQF